MRRLRIGKRRSSALVAAALLVLASAPSSGHAEWFGGVRVPAEFRSWKVEPDGGGTESRVTQLLVPLIATVRLGADADLVIAANLATSRLESGNEEVSLSGVSPVTTRVYWRLPAAGLQLNGALTLPGGTTSLNAQELSLSQVLGSPLLGFRERDLGSGYEASLGATVVRSFSPAITLSLGAAGTTRGAFSLDASGEEFGPGPEMSLTAGLDWKPPDTEGPAPIRIDATYRGYGVDERGGRSAFEQGDQLELQVEGRWGAQSFPFQGLVRATRKQSNRTLDPSGVILGAFHSSSGDGLLARLGTTRIVSERVRVGLGAYLGRVRNSDEFSRNGDVYGVGPSLIVQLSETLSLDTGGDWLWGRQFGFEGSPESRLNGLSFRMGLGWRPGT